MGSRTFTVLAALSAVICAGSGALWARSYTWIDAVGLGPPGWRRPGIVSEDGVLLMAWPAGPRDGWRETPVRWGSVRFRARTNERLVFKDRWGRSTSLLAMLKLGTGRAFWEPVGPAGFACRVEFHQDGAWNADLPAGAPGVPAPRKWYVAAAPHWALASAASVLPAGWVAGRLRVRRRRRTGRCAACGYDLRASPEGGGATMARCPDCGREASAGQLLTGAQRRLFLPLKTWEPGAVAEGRR